MNVDGRDEVVHLTQSAASMIGLIGYSVKPLGNRAVSERSQSQIDDVCLHIPAK